MVVDEINNNYVSDESCRRFYEKLQIRMRGGRSVQLPISVMNNRTTAHYCSYLGHPIKATFVRGISDHRDFVFVFIELFLVTQIRPLLFRGSQTIVTFFCMRWAFPFGSFDP